MSDATFANIVDKLITIVGNLVYLVLALGLLSFLYGLYGYIVNSGDENKRKESIQYIVYGLIGLFVMVAVWGLVAILANVLGQSVSIPQISI